MSESAQLHELNDSLKEKLLKWLPEQSRLETPISGLALTRHDENTSAIRCFYTPMIALVAQGFKRSMIGDHEANYGELHCVTVGIDMPGVFHITNASPQAPFLSLSVKLDRRIITQLITEAPSLVAAQEGEVTPVVVDEVDKELLQAFSRLVELLDTPSRNPGFGSHDYSGNPLLSALRQSGEMSAAFQHKRNTGKPDRPSYFVAKRKLYVTDSHGRIGPVCQHGSLNIQSAF